jgi:hypothetical protein
MRSLGVPRSEKAGVLSPYGGISPELETWSIYSTRLK